MGAETTSSTAPTREVKFSLQARDPMLARVGNLHALAEIERSWSRLAPDDPAQLPNIKLLLIQNLAGSAPAPTADPQLEQEAPGAARS